MTPTLEVMRKTLKRQPAGALAWQVWETHPDAKHLLAEFVAHDDARAFAEMLTAQIRTLNQ